MLHCTRRTLPSMHAPLAVHQSSLSWHVTLTYSGLPVPLPLRLVPSVRPCVSGSNHPELLPAPSVIHFPFGSVHLSSKHREWETSYREFCLHRTREHHSCSTAFLLVIAYISFYYLANSIRAVVVLWIASL